MTVDRDGVRGPFQTQGSLCRHCSSEVSIPRPEGRKIGAGQQRTHFWVDARMEKQGSQVPQLCRWVLVAENCASVVARLLGMTPRHICWPGPDTVG